MKLKPVIDTENLKAAPRPAQQRLAEWARARSALVMGGAGGLLALTLLFSGYLYFTSLKDDRAAERYAAARTAEDFLAILKEYPQAKVSPLAAFSLAALYEEKEDWSQAETYFRLFAEKYPDHFLAPQAAFALAFLAERKGDTASAVEQYRKLLLDPRGEVLSLEITRALDRCERKMKSGSS